MRKLLIPLSLLAALGLIGGIYANWFKRYPSIRQANEACEEWVKEWPFVKTAFNLEVKDVENVRTFLDEFLMVFPQSKIKGEKIGYINGFWADIKIQNRSCIQEKETNQILGIEFLIPTKALWEYRDYQELIYLSKESKVIKNFRYPIQK